MAKYLDSTENTTISRLITCGIQLAKCFEHNLVLALVSLQWQVGQQDGQNLLDRYTTRVNHKEPGHTSDNLVDNLREDN